MFGSNKKETESVPVYTVQMVPGQYELIGTVAIELNNWAKIKIDQPLEELGKEAAKLGADAVIGFMTTGHMGTNRHVFYGTAIKFTE